MRLGVIAIGSGAWSGDGPSRPAPFVFGRSVGQHQLVMLAALGADRIVCLTPELSADALALQRSAERAGLGFHAVSERRGLAGLVTSGCDVVLLSEGLLADSQQIRELLDDRAGLVVLPADVGVDHGFERIDAARAFAGVLRVRGHMVDRLDGLPPDIDVPSALLRIALQGGTRVIEAPASILAEGSWRLVRHEREARAYENALLRRHAALALWSTPSQALGERMADRVHDRLSPRLIAGAAAALGAAAAVLAWLGYGAAALAAAALFPMMLSAALRTHVIASLSPEGAGEADRRWPPWVGAFLLAIAILLLDYGTLWFPAVMLGGLIMAMHGVTPRRSRRAIFADSGLWAAICAILAAADMLSIGATIAAVVLLIMVLGTVYGADNGALTMRE